MGNFASKIKSKLDKVIRETAECAYLYARNPAKDFTRNRKISFERLVKTLLAIGGNSLNKELYDEFKYDSAGVTTSAFVQQRDKLLPEGLEALFHAFNDECCNGKTDEKTYEGYRLLAVDGCTLTYNGFAGDDTFMENSGEDGVNQFHLNALFDLRNKVYVDALVQPNPNMNEPKAAWKMMERSVLNGDSIFIADRGYASINLIEHINRIDGAEYLIRIKNEQWKEMQSLPMAECDVDIVINLRTTQTNADKEAFAAGTAKYISGQGKHCRRKAVVWDFESPFSCEVRIVRFKITDDTYETIATSLPREQFPMAKIKKLYHMRWGIETSFRELKYAIGLINFHAKKRDSVLQEIFAALIMYNFCERITMHTVIKQGKRAKWTYQANFTMAIHICRDFFRNREHVPPDPEERIEKYINPVRPDRRDTRKVVQKKSAVYFLYRVA